MVTMNNQNNTNHGSVTNLTDTAKQWLSYDESKKIAYANAKAEGIKADTTDYQIDVIAHEWEHYDKVNGVWQEIGTDVDGITAGLELYREKLREKEEIENSEWSGLADKELDRKLLAKAIKNAYTYGHEVDVRWDGSAEYGWLADRSQVAWHCEALQPGERPPTQKSILEELKRREQVG
jgi:hypothetical protein